MFDVAFFTLSALPLVAVIGVVTWMFFYDFRAFRLSRVHDLEAEVTALEASLAEGRGNAATAATLMQDAADTLAASTAEIARLKAELTANAEKYLQAESRAKSAAACAAKELLDRVSLELNQAHLKAELATLREFANTLHTDLATARVQLGILRTANTAAATSINRLETQNQDLVAEHKSHLYRLSELQAQVERLTETLHGVQENEATRIHELNAAVGQVADLKMGAAVLKRDRDARGDQAHAAALQIVELHADRDRLSNANIARSKLVYQLAEMFGIETTVTA